MAERIIKQQLLKKLKIMETLLLIIAFIIMFYLLGCVAAGILVMVDYVGVSYCHRWNRHYMRTILKKESRGKYLAVVKTSWIGCNLMVDHMSQKQYRRIEKL